MEVTDKITITNEDNMLLMARYSDNYFDLAIVDPPYGIGESGGKNRNNKKGSAIGLKTPNYTKKDWDNSIPPKEYFLELQRISKNQIIWGGNYFIEYLKPTSCFLVWDKKETAKGDFADCELAWTSFKSAVRKFTYGWIGFDYLNNPHKEKKIHPTQKPVALYKWILDKYAKENDKILDTHLGSGSIAIACHDYGFDLTACELDQEYYDKAIQRIKNHTNQQKLF
jgi:site-specific DNA-methyltransferase (adenine-specific)